MSRSSYNVLVCNNIATGDSMSFLLIYYINLSSYLHWTVFICVKVSVLSTSAVGHGFEFRSGHGQTKDLKIGISCISAEHTALRDKKMALKTIKSLQ